MKYYNYLLPLSLVISAMGYADASHEEMPKQCSTPNRVMHVGVRQTEARGVGYKSGYSTLEAFGIYNRWTSFMPFIDLRGHHFNNGKYAGNVGIGGRGWLVNLHHVLGYYLYYDVRQSHRGLTPQQLGPGLELLGKRMEYRINGYLPIGKDKSEKYDYRFDSFKGNRILLRNKQRRVFTGGDAEIGAHLTQSMNYDVYAGAGPYYFSASHTSAWGGKARLLGRYRQYASLEASYSYDHLFGSIVQGSVALNLPFGMKLKFKKDKQCEPKHNLALSRAVFAPYRFEIPVVKNVHHKQTAINPATGSPWKVWFVDNTSSSNGTFESPFSTLVDAENASAPNDMIYVFPGDGTTTGMDMGIVLQDVQKFFGSGISHRIHTTKGKMKIPAFSHSSPTITNTSGSVVTLANGDEVSGFNVLMTLSGSIGVDGTSGINGTNINHNSLFGDVDYQGIHIVGQGDVDVTHNQLVNSVSTSTTFVGIGVAVLNGQFMDAYVSDNTVTGFAGAGIDFGPLTNPTTASAKGVIEKNTISGFEQAGIIYFTGMPNSIVKIIDNLVIDNAGDVMGGIGTDQGAIVANVNNPPDSGTVIISRNTVLTPTTTDQQFGITAQINAPTGAKFRAIVTDNTVFTGSGMMSVGMSFFSRGNLCATVSGNQITSQAATGTTDLNLSTVGATSVINVNDLSNNVAEHVRITGNINIVKEGTCGN